MLIDGSNLALYGQNWAHGGFDFAQIGAAYDHAIAQFPDLKPLVVRAGRCVLLKVTAYNLVPGSGREDRMTGGVMHNVVAFCGWMAHPARLPL